MTLLRVLAGLAAFAWLEKPLVRPVPGLVIEYVQSVEARAYAWIATLDRRGPDGTRYADAEAMGSLKATPRRRIGGYLFDSAEDLQKSHHMVMCFFARDEERFPGATQRAVSREVFDELTAGGESQVVLVEVAGEDGGCGPGSHADGYKNFRGTIKRVGIEPLRVMVDGSPAMLPALHARGTMKFRDETHDADFWWLNDADYRLVLQYKFIASDYRAVRINHPQNDESRAKMMAALGGKSCRAELEGIYFRTGEAQILSPSRPAIDAIAGALKANAGWKITIEGHTDTVGGATANLDLSKRRADALKAELVSGYSIDPGRIRTEGLGSTRPVDSNTTVEGRAHNRRVEVARACQS